VIQENGVGLKPTVN